MSGRISRNPWIMNDYANSLNKSIENLESTLLDTSHKLDVYVEELDSKSRDAVGKFNEVYKKLNGQLDEYRNLSDMLKKNADALIDLHEKTHF